MRNVFIIPLSPALPPIALKGIINRLPLPPHMPPIVSLSLLGPPVLAAHNRNNLCINFAALKIKPLLEALALNRTGK